MRLVKASMLWPCLCSDDVSCWSTCVDRAIISWLIRWTSVLSSWPRSFKFFQVAGLLIGCLILKQQSESLPVSVFHLVGLSFVLGVLALWFKLLCNQLN